MALPWRARFSPAEATGAFADHDLLVTYFGVRSLVLTGGCGVAVDFYFTEAEYSCLSWQGQSHVTSLHAFVEVVCVRASNTGDGCHANGARTRQIHLKDPDKVALT